MNATFSLNKTTMARISILTTFVAVALLLATTTTTGDADRVGSMDIAARHGDDFRTGHASSSPVPAGVASSAADHGDWDTADNGDVVLAKLSRQLQFCTRILTAHNGYTVNITSSSKAAIDIAEFAFKNVRPCVPKQSIAILEDPASILQRIYYTPGDYTKPTMFHIADITNAVYRSHTTTLLYNDFFHNRSGSLDYDFALDTCALLVNAVCPTRDDDTIRQIVACILRFSWRRPPRLSAQPTSPFTVYGSAMRDTLLDPHLAAAFVSSSPTPPPRTKHEHGN